MLNIIYKTAIYTYQTRSPIISGGMVACFNGNREVTIGNPKLRPIGFFIYDADMKAVPITQDWVTVGVCVGQGEYQTDIYEPGDYKIEDLLWCSPNGKITNHLSYYPPNVQPIGIVNYVDEELIGFITTFSYK